MYFLHLGAVSDTGTEIPSRHQNHGNSIPGTLGSCYDG